MNAPALPHNLTEEAEAASKHQYSLCINMGGIEDFTVYFSIEGGDTPDEWVVAEDAKCFYKGADVTNLFDGSVIDEKIYDQKKEVESMMADSWADHMIDKYADADCD